MYLGFNIAAFAFLSQYLAFPKDILAELSRAKRHANLHEFPYKASRVTNNIKDKEASDTIKAFFLEADTVTYTTLIYLLFSIAVILLIIMANLLKADSLLKIIIFYILCIMVCAFYIHVIVNPMNNELKANARKWPQKYQSAKKMYLTILSVISFLLGLISIKFFLTHDHESLFMLLIFGLLIHFAFCLLPIFYRKPVTNLLVLWENLRK